MEFSFTKIVDFINSTGTSKIKIVRQAIEALETDYSAVKDYYKEIREHIIQYFKNPEEKFAVPKKWSSEIVKEKLFIDFAQKIKKRFRPKKIKWIDNISRKTLIFEQLDININPEIYFEHNGVKYIIKLYFKEEELNNKSAELLLLMLKKAYGEEYSDFILGIYDIRKNRLFSSDKLKISNDTEMALNEELKQFKNYVETVPK
jgi:hypothetical protein